MVGQYITLYFLIIAGGITSQIAVGIPSQQVREQIISNSLRGPPPYGRRRFSGEP